MVILGLGCTRRGGDDDEASPDPDAGRDGDGGGDGDVDGDGDGDADLDRDAGPPMDPLLCDDGNDSACDGCEGGQRRRWVSLTGAELLATLPGGGSAQDGACVEAWVNPGFDTVHFGARFEGQRFWLECGNTFKVLADGPAEENDGWMDVPCDDGWHHIAVCAIVEHDPSDWPGGWNDITVTSFLDGSPGPTLWRSEADLGSEPANPPLTEASIFGGFFDGSDGFTGSIDEIRVSRGIRYERDVPFDVERRYERDDDTLALLHCDDGSLGDAETTFEGRGRISGEADTGYRPEDCR